MLAFNAIPFAQAMENTTYAAQAAWLCRGPTLGPGEVAPDRGVATNSATAYSPMLSPVEIGVVVICVFIVCLVAICMCAFAAKKTSMKQAEAVPPPPPDYA